MSASSYNTSFEQWKSARAKLAQATEEFISASASICAELSSGSQSPPFGVVNMSESDFASIKSDGMKVEKHMAALIQARKSLPNLVAFNRLPQQIKTWIFEFACTHDRRRVNEPDQVCASPWVLAAVCASWR
ncbi:hypothetical protein RhiLY_06078 [Ceratobasidium sp. AG-Ba]|nr:hypothetical protein RhiLY_06078 [Ceratobasidium sp. AG-Ba]